MALLGVLAVLVAVGCSACALLLSRLHRRRRTKQPSTDTAINNQRHFCTLIRNLDHGEVLLAHGGHSQAQAVPSALQPEEIELTLPPSPAPSPALKPTPGPKLDICNREREKLNRFHHADSQELEA